MQEPTLVLNFQGIGEKPTTKRELDGHLNISWFHQREIRGFATQQQDIRDFAKTRRTSIAPMILASQEFGISHHKTIVNSAAQGEVTNKTWATSKPGVLSRQICYKLPMVKAFIPEIHHPMNAIPWMKHDLCEVPADTSGTFLQICGNSTGCSQLPCWGFPKTGVLPGYPFHPPNSSIATELRLTPTRSTHSGITEAFVLILSQSSILSWLQGYSELMFFFPAKAQIESGKYACEQQTHAEANRTWE